ncbi:MAG TPA: metal ABC transporter permease [Phycisphaerales bacterium]|nr:metal ABC transporter permease [Phycisphaerales bacterium]
MSGGAQAFLMLDLMPLSAAVLAALGCGLLGNFLVLRRQSLLGDAISHSVLPGIVVAFLVTGSRSPAVMLPGAAGAGLLSVLLTDLVRRIGRVEPGAAMGVVFSLFFAAGVYLMQQAARNVDLDADCVLYGQLETLFWTRPSGAGLLSAATLASVPRQVTTLVIVAACAVGFIALLYKELRLTSFDPDLATSLGFRAGWVGAMLLALVAAATVASFEAVGSILVVAMLICPAATARLLTDRMDRQLVLSGLIAGATAAAGYFAGTRLPGALGLPGAVNAAGAIAVVAGLAFALAAVASPSHGIVARALRRQALSRRIAVEDLLGALYRRAEAGPGAAPLAARLLRAAPLARRLGLVAGAPAQTPSLTEKGETAARAIVRRHRLWEAYLVERAGMLPDHVHEPAEALEHVLDAESPGLGLDPLPVVDPQGKRIPGDGGAPPGQARSKPS